MRQVSDLPGVYLPLLWEGAAQEDTNRSPICLSYASGHFWALVQKAPQDKISRVPLIDEQGEQHYLDVHVAYRQACLNAINYMTKFGYTEAQAYAILGCAPVQGHISGVVDIPNACATLWLPTDVFDFDIQPGADGPSKGVDSSEVDIPIAPDLD